MGNEICLKENINYYFKHIPLQLNRQEVIFYSNNPIKTNKNNTKNIKKIQLNYEIEIGIKLNRVYNYSEYNMLLINKIIEFRNRNITYKNISKYFIGNGYLGIYNGILKDNLIERIYKKYLISINNRKIKFIKFSEIRISIFK